MVECLLNCMVGVNIIIGLRSFFIGGLIGGPVLFNGVVCPVIFLLILTIIVVVVFVVIELTELIGQFTMVGLNWLQVIRPVSPSALLVVPQPRAVWPAVQICVSWRRLQRLV